MSKSVSLPRTIDSGLWPYGHCQGIAVDTNREYIYYSFTTALIKTDLRGNLIGTVTGLLGHLGCLDFCDEDGRLYGSLEYKNDAIGRGILRHLGSDAVIRDAFYIAIFDVDKIDRVGMDACTDGVMTCVYLKEVYDDFSASVKTGGRTVQHRHGCSGIDGVTFGKIPGSVAHSLFVAYGVYADENRADNDYQVILRYDTKEWPRLARPLSQSDMHTSGPDAPDDKFFVYTGNTTYGVQNLEYDEATGNFLMAVYRGKKPGFPNYDLYAIDGAKSAKTEVLRGIEYAKEASVLSLVENGKPVTPGWYFPYGSTGMCSLGDGLFYISREKSTDGKHGTQVALYRWTGGEIPFEEAP